MNNDYPVGSFNLDKRLVEVLQKKNIKYFSSIQRKVIPKLLLNDSVLALAQTGTGKTLSFVLPIINNFLSNLKDKEFLQAIIISPTNYLLDQIKKVIVSFFTDFDLSLSSIKCIKSNSDLNNNTSCNIILTTPSLLKQVIKKNDISHVNKIIIDEGDMIIYDGFSEIISSLSLFIKKSIVSIFSASINIQEIKRIKSTFKIKHVFDVRDNLINTSLISHNLVSYRGISKENALIRLIAEKKINKAIVFTSSKKELFDLNNNIIIPSYKVFTLHGDLNKDEIKSIINSFDKSNYGILLSSDYLSRGIDLNNIDDIISYSLPNDLTYYFHRAGRCGRFFTSGNSYILFDENSLLDKKRLNDLSRRNIDFKLYILNNNSLKENKGPYVFKNLGKKDQSNEKLQKQIRHAVNLTKSKKIRPNYKKKVKKAVERVKEKHRRKVILTNIGKKGGNTKDFHN